MIYLASQSPRRKEILQKMRMKFRVVKSSYHEKPKKLPPVKLVLEHAVGKALGAKISASKGLVLGSDTIVYCAGKVLGKPKTTAHALAMLRLICGRDHFVYTGVALLNLKDGKIVKGYDRTKVTVKKLSKPEMLDYIKKVNSLDKAGAYAIQLKPFIVKKTQGSRSNVIGLPIGLVRKLLKLV